jgi:branched-chain amino acid transport system permease protein
LLPTGALWLHVQRVAELSKEHAVRAHSEAIAVVIVACALIIAPVFAYPVFLMKALCFALFACAFNLLIGYVGLLSFGHALFFDWASYISALGAAAWPLVANA